jgi:hypothetical protein
MAKDNFTEKFNILTMEEKINLIYRAAKAELRSQQKEENVTYVYELENPEVLSCDYKTNLVIVKLSRGITKIGKEKKIIKDRGLTKQSSGAEGAGHEAEDEKELERHREEEYTEKEGIESNFLMYCSLDNKISEEQVQDALNLMKENKIENAFFFSNLGFDSKAIKEIENYNFFYLDLNSLEKTIEKNNLSLKKAVNEIELPPAPGCFIATAAYGSALHPDIEFLRDFRDNIVLKSRFNGFFRILLNFYYLWSPYLAKQMKKYNCLKQLIKFTIVYPFVYLTKISAKFIVFFKNQI